MDLWISRHYGSRIEAYWKIDGSDTGLYELMRAAFLSGPSMAPAPAAGPHFSQLLG